MKISKKLTVVAILILFLIVSNFIAFSLIGKNVVNASSTTGSTTDNNLLQYEWPQFQGDKSSARFSDGPAPDAPDILWKTNITGIQSYLTAFNGKVYVCTKTAVYALDRETGAIIWNTTVPAPGRWPVAYKIDGTHMVVGNCSLDPETGKIQWTAANFTANAANFASGAYVPEEKMFYIKVRSYVQAWDFSNPDEPPIFRWETYVSGGGNVGSGVQYGDGKLFPGSFEAHQMAIDAKTGKVLWDVETKGGMLFAGSYYAGKFYRGCPFDNTFYCFNASNGNIIWTFNPGTHDGYFASGSAAAYGMVYALSKDGYLYAMDADTGDLVWKYKGPGPLFFPGNPTIADGKVYATTGQRASYDPAKGNYSHSEFACLDAYTGQVIWKMDTEAFPPRESVAIAYGNIYFIPAFIKELEMDDYTIMDQVWAIGTRDWSMWRRDAAHTAAGQSGPTNLTLRWKFETGGSVVSSPSASEGRIFVGSGDKNLYALDAKTGDLLWKFNTSARIESSPAVVNGKVYLGPDDGYIYCINAYTGEKIWSTFAGGYIPVYFASAVMLRSSPAVADGRVYVGSLDKKVYCLDADNGDVDWTYQTQGYITSSPAVDNGTVYVVSQENGTAGLYMLDAVNGNLIRRIALPYQGQVSRGTDMHSSPTVANGMIYAASNKQAYYAINASTGVIKWTFKDTSADEFIIASPIYNNGKVYLVDQFYIVALDAVNGTQLWQAFLGTEFYVSPTFADGKLYVTSDQRGVYVLNATDGSKLSFYGTSSNSWSSSTLYDGKLYVGCNDWNVYCLAEAPALVSNLTIKPDKTNLTLGGSVNVSGCLVPGMTNQSILVTFVRPDGSMDNMQVATVGRGLFNCVYTPNLSGTWVVTAQWNSTIGIYSSAYSEYVPIEVTLAPTQTPTPTPPAPKTLPLEYIIAIAASIVVILLLLAYFFKRKNRKK